MSPIKDHNRGWWGGYLGDQPKFGAGLDEQLGYDAGKAARDGHGSRWVGFTYPPAVERALDRLTRVLAPIGLALGTWLAWRLGRDFGMGLAGTLGTAAAGGIAGALLCAGIPRLVAGAAMMAVALAVLAAAFVLVMLVVGFAIW